MVFENVSFPDALRLNQRAPRYICCTAVSATIVMYRRACAGTQLGISSLIPPIQLSRGDEVIGSDIFNIQLNWVALLPDRVP